LFQGLDAPGASRTASLGSGIQLGLVVHDHELNFEATDGKRGFLLSCWSADGDCMARGNWSAAFLFMIMVTSTGCDSASPPAPSGPDPAEISRALGVKVETIPNEVRQYLVHAERSTVDFTKIGRVHQDLGYAVGVTLPSGMQIGFRFAPPSK